MTRLTTSYRRLCESPPPPISNYKFTNRFEKLQQWEGESAWARDMRDSSPLVRAINSHVNPRKVYQGWLRDKVYCGLFGERWWPGGRALWYPVDVRRVRNWQERSNGIYQLAPLWSRQDRDRVPRSAFKWDGHPKHQYIECSSFNPPRRLQGCTKTYRNTKS